MKLIRARLSACGLGNIRNKINDFDFIVGETRYSCPSFIADFLSPKISQLRDTDATIHEYKLNTKDTNNQFSSFISFGQGYEVEINDANRTFIRSVSEELLNNEIIDLIFKSSGDTITLENVISRLLDLSAIDGDYSKELSFTASHFFELDESKIEELNVEILSEILKSVNIKIKSEDWLCGLILDFVLRDRNYYPLFEFIRFEWLSSDMATRFIDLTSEFLNYLSPSIWASFGRRFTLPVSPQDPNPRFTRNLFPFKADSPFEGIVAYLTSQCDGNVHDCGIVNVTSSSCSNNAKNVADLQNGTSFSQCQSSNSDPWICYDFKNMQITPTHYSVLSYHGGPGNYHPKSWYLEGSNDEKNWTILHESVNNNDLNGSSLIGKYEVSKSMQCRFIRLRQTEHHCQLYQNFHYLTLSGFEIHGYLYES